ncbi:uncharacterized protein BJ212DRAFT_1397259 [Suillus subaureus]|uniref:Uncharacterized protein n=1 Tax=Suillus subaureus TaxID=48587 RepID=A0A9P7DU69_9AGAM|nr:uncharacterized protein BJ212DRAFT_1397259 [Suillus subaureus]KAG1802983.1 hypothetical protein BJ212DRAFT_1397259 [Suillus subaureus]
MGVQRGWVSRAAWEEWRWWWMGRPLSVGSGNVDSLAGACISMRFLSSFPFFFFVLYAKRPESEDYLISLLFIISGAQPTMVLYT